ncbi:MAG: sulfite exporter TauE/SafE family protein [Candidatus Acidiferrales bacterium]
MTTFCPRMTPAILALETALRNPALAAERDALRPGNFFPNTDDFYRCGRVFFRVHFGRSLFLFTAAFFGGAINSVAGGGSFLTFPALLFIGIPPIAANATSTAAVWPGTVASMFAYRKAFTAEARRLLPPLLIMGVIGGVLGAHILLKTPQDTFMKLIPWLLLLATLLFVTSGRITRWMRARTSHHGSGNLLMIAGGLLLELLISMYIGYFGAGVGILILALLALLGMENIHTMNATKTVLVTVVNGVALSMFIWSKVVVWPEAIVMIVGAVLGGYGGASVAQKVNPQYIRRLVILIGFAMSAYFFVRY